MPVWFGRWLQGADTLQAADGIAIRRGRDFSARLHAGPRRRKPTHTKHMIVDTTHCTHENARMG
jgi:hypothetical protein